MDESALQLVSAIGTKLVQLSRPNKDFIVKSLRQAVSALSQIEQPEASKKLQAVKKLEDAFNPLRKSIVERGLLHHNDKDIRLLVAICVSEVFRILAPEPPFKDKYLRDIFKLIISTFAELADTNSPYFSRRVKILETVARCKCCVILLDVDCNDLVLEMFNIFFYVVREHHQQNLITDILSIMTHILNEETSQQLMDVVLRNLIKDGKAAASASRLAVSVIQSCAEKLEPFVCGFLTSCILDRDAVGSELKEFYHDIMFRIFQCAPKMVVAVIPNFTQELVTDQVDVRIKAVNLAGKLFASPDHQVVQNYRALFLEFLKRFSDKSAEVRFTAVQCAKACYMANPSRKESEEILTAVEGRLLDFDERVRMQAVVVACDLARFNLRFVPPKLLSEATERLRDKKISVRKKALLKLLELYRDYCLKCSQGYLSMSDHFEQIPCKILLLCYDKDCKEFRSQNMEFVLAEDLFPVLLSVEERTRHWIHLFSLFTPLHLKAFNSILFQKRRLQTDMQLYLALRKKEKENQSEETREIIKRSFVKMSASFVDPSKAEECFHKLDQIKDKHIFDAMEQLLEKLSITDAQNIRGECLKMIGEKHQLFEFLQSLSAKCMFSIFSSEHISSILDLLTCNETRNKQLEDFSVKLLLAIINVFPSLLRGLELPLRMLLEKNDQINHKLIEVLAKAGPHVSIIFSDFYPFLKRVCLEGNRSQSKHAVSAMASLIGDTEPIFFTQLCEDLVRSLHSGRNIPTVLQSLGCIAQHSISTFESYDRDITTYIMKKIFQVETSDDQTLCIEASGCSALCRLKIYGLKTLVQSFLPHGGSHIKRQINKLLDILSTMLQKGDAFDGIFSCENDKAHIRLAAAKSVLRLSRRWDLHISPDIFHFTILLAKDPCSFVRRSLLDKIHKMWKEHLIPSRYACAFAFATSDCLKDLQDGSHKYMEEFIKQYNREAQICRTSVIQGGSITDYPAYIVVFLIHALAHDKSFPPEDCLDEGIYARFCCPLFSIMHVLLNENSVSGDMDVVNDAVTYLLCIFRAIKKADDAIDAQITPKLHILADIGISIINALKLTGISSSAAPRLMLLPSAFYKTSNVTKYDGANVKPLTQFALDESFIDRIIGILKSNLSLSVGTFLKRGQKCREESIWTSRKQVDILPSGVTETRKRIGRNKQKQALSPPSIESIDVQNKRSSVEDCDNGPSKGSVFILRKEQLASSCDSVSTKHSQNVSQVSTQNEESTILKESVWANTIVTAEPPEDPGPKFKDPSCSKITDKNGEVELLYVDTGSWETLSDNSLARREFLRAEDSNTLNDNAEAHCSPNSLKENKFGDRATEKLKSLLNQEMQSFPSMNILPAKGRKEENILVTSASEVTHGNEDAVVRRTRRRKV